MVITLLISKTYVNTITISYQIERSAHARCAIILEFRNLFLHLPERFDTEIISELSDGNTR